MNSQRTPLDAIHVPPAKIDEDYVTRVDEREYRFRGLKRLLGAADVSKAGDRHARLAAADDLERQAARRILASLELAHFYEQPLTDEHGHVDSVMRVNYEIDRVIFDSLARMTIGEFKDHLLRSSAESIAPLGHALTGPMAAALAKICDVHELIYLARKMPRISRARTTLGQPGTLASRLQPNHPTDDLRGITLLIYWGLSLGAGDALWGVNPAIDNVDNIEAILRHLDRLRRSLEVPTQICVLSHVKTQLAALERGAPVEILFQSLAGTERTLTEEFDVTVELLDEASQIMHARGPLGDVAKQVMYFETGQGSEFTYGKHNGIDMATTEALCYGLARRYDPFMVNNVTGFIGPETHLDSFEMILANLQDHFMGKLLGLPMGMAPCFTLHSAITLEGQQIATELLTAAGANYYMDVCLNTDRMLAYFDTSAHDDQTLREVHDRRPAPEFAEWGICREIFERDGKGRIVRGKRWGDVSQFCRSAEELDELRRATPAAYDFETAGPRPSTTISCQVRTDRAIGRQSVHAELRVEELMKLANFRQLSTQATSKDEHLNHPELGSRLSNESLARLSVERHQVQIVVTDGLSAEAVHYNVAQVLQVVQDGLGARQIDVGQPILVHYGRVKLAEPIAEVLGAELVILLVGERPGGDTQSARSLSAYLVYRGLRESTRTASSGASEPSGTFEYSIISNIHSGGLPPLEGGATVVSKAFQILTLQAAGNRLEQLLGQAAAR